MSSVNNTDLDNTDPYSIHKLESNSLDSIKIYNFFTHNEIDTAIIEEAYRVLKPGGKLLINFNIGRGEVGQAKQVKKPLQYYIEAFKSFHFDVHSAHRYDKTAWTRVNAELRKPYVEKKLDIVFVTTKAEVERGEFARCLNHYFKDDNAYTIRVFTDKDVVIQPHKSLNIIHTVIGISDFDNIYKRTPQELSSMKLKDIPPLGGSSGPNNLFFGAFKHLVKEKADGFLVLETDTQPMVDDWFPRLQEAFNTKDFLILGSTYKGDQENPTYQDWTGHLNGVGIFANNKHLGFLMEHTENLIREKIKTNKSHFHSDATIHIMSLKHSFCISYDLGMHLLRQTKIGQEKFSNPDDPSGHFLDSEYIINASSDADKGKSLEYFREKFPKGLILHKKYEDDLYMSDDDDEKSIYIMPQQGLGNRLLQVDSIYAHAKEHGFSSIKIYWHKTKGFSDEKFEDLLDWPYLCSLSPKFSLCTHEEYVNARSRYLKLDEYFHQNDKLNYVFNVDRKIILHKIKNESFTLESFVSIDWLFPILNLKHRFEFLRNHVKPSEKIQLEIDKYKIDGHVGLHIRAGDALISPWQDNYKKSKLDHYEAIINSNEKIFLTTDSETQEKYFKDLYGDKILCSEKRFVDSGLKESNNKEFQAEALIDMILLSKTNKIYGTNWSTFNQVASIIGYRDRVELSDENLRYHELTKVKRPYSVVTVTKNRFNILKSSINSWLIQEEVKEVVVVDYGSDDFDEKYMKELDQRVKVIRVESEYFNLSKAYNIALENAEYDNILKLDVDYFINPYFQINEWMSFNLDNAFVTGNWEHKEKDNSMGFLEYLNGLLICKRKHLEQAGNYDGNKHGYGWDDCDLYIRLRDKCGLSRMMVNFRTNYAPIFHIPHLDFERTKFYKEKDITASLHANQKEFRERHNLNKLHDNIK